MTFEFLAQPLNHLDNYGGNSAEKNDFYRNILCLRAFKAKYTKIPCFRNLPRTDETVDLPFLLSSQQTKYNGQSETAAMKKGISKCHALVTPFISMMNSGQSVSISRD